MSRGIVTALAAGFEGMQHVPVEDNVLVSIPLAPTPVRRFEMRTEKRSVITKTRRGGARPMRGGLAAGVALLALLGVMVISPASIVSASNESAHRQEQLDPRLVAFCLLLGGSVDQCAGYLRREGG